MSHWRDELLLLPTQRVLQRALDDDSIDEGVLRGFALDCAARAIFSEHWKGWTAPWYRELLQRGWACLNQMKLWWLDEDMAPLVHEAREKVLDVAFLSKHAHRTPSSWDLLSRFHKVSVGPGKEEELFYRQEYAVIDAVLCATELGTSLEQDVDVGACARWASAASTRIPSLDEPMQARDNEIEWQCLRLHWWLTFSASTKRLWLAYSPENPLPPEPQASLFYDQPETTETLFPAPDFSTAPHG